MCSSLSTFKVYYITLFTIVGVFNNHRGSAVGRTQHGPCGVCTGRGPEKVHQCQGIHQLSLLQRSMYTRHLLVIYYLFIDCRLSPVEYFVGLMMGFYIFGRPYCPLVVIVGVTLLPPDANSFLYSSPKPVIFPGYCVVILTDMFCNI